MSAPSPTGGVTTRKENNIGRKELWRTYYLGSTARQLRVGIASIWGLPWGDEINQSIVVISTLLATIIEISKAQWRKDHAIEIKDFTEEK